MDILNPRQLWESYDRNIPPDETVIKTTEDGLVRHIYFNGPACSGDEYSQARVRVYAKLVLPKCENPPVLIYAGGMNEDIDGIDVSFFTSGGYAVLVVDYAGETSNKARYSLYPQGIDTHWQADKEKIKTPRSLKDCCWYYWTACILHAAIYLENCPLVDKNKIGIIGICEGAPLVWKSSESGVIKGGLTFFGGDFVVSGSGRDFAPSSSADTEAGTEESYDMLAYKAALESRAYAKTAYPVLINAATNSRECSFDYLGELYENSPAAAFCVCPDADAAASGVQRDNILPWFDSILNEKTLDIPKKGLTVFGSGGVLYAEVETTAETVEIYYAEDCTAACRHFKRIIPPKSGENKYLAKLDVFDINRPVLVFANITTSDFTFSTPVINRLPSKLGASKGEGAFSRLIFVCEDQDDVDDNQNTGFLRPNGSFLERKKLSVVTGPLGLKGICGNELITFKPGDARFKVLPESLLQMTVSVAEAQDIEICIIDRTGNEYNCTKKIAAGQWITLSLSGAEFKSVKGAADFSKATGIKIKGQKIILNSILWV